MKKLLLILTLLAAPLSAAAQRPCATCTCGANCKCEDQKCRECTCTGNCRCETRTVRNGKITVRPSGYRNRTTIDFGGGRVVISDYDNDSSVQIGFGRHSWIDSPWSKRDRVTWFPYVSLGYNGLVSGLDKMELAAGDRWMNVSARSRNFRLMLVQGSTQLGRWGSLRTGLELEVENFRWDTNMALMRDAQGIVMRDPAYDGVRFRKSKLVNSWFNVPLTLHITPGRRFDVYGGVVGGLRLSSYQKLRAPEFGKRHIKRQNLNLRNAHFGYTAGFYYGRWGLYASYYPHSIFRSGGANARAVSVGLSMKTGCPHRWWK